MNNFQEPVAIIGMACRWPGDVDSASSLWELLSKSRTGQTPVVPSSRFNIHAHYHANGLRPGSFNALGGYFLAGNPVDFDPGLFGISHVEATWMDPQHRKMLEVVYECFEAAGATLDSVSGSQTGCFMGTFTTDFQQITVREPDFRHAYTASGVDPCLLSNRVSHTFNLCGPSLTLNTACSSSLYGIHLAWNALHNNDCRAAIVGGSNLIFTVDQHMNTAKLGVLSPTSTCHTFDASADGYGRAEGVGALYLKLLSDAVRDGDPIRSVIRASAINSNEKVPGFGITHPNRDGQERVIRAAYAAANLSPMDTGYFECHGTGTFVGDPIEVEAVSRAMNDQRSDTDEPLLIGSVKTNLGHSEPASGIAAVMKATLIVSSGMIPPVIGFSNPNPGIDFAGWKVKVVTKMTPFPKHKNSRRVSVNSFGYGGTNAHLILEDAESAVKSWTRDRNQAEKNVLPDEEKENKTRYSLNSLLSWTLRSLGYSEDTQGPSAPNETTKGNPHLLLFSAHDKKTLVKNIEKLREVTQCYELPDLAYSLAVYRTHLSCGGYHIATASTVTQDLDPRNTSLVDRRLKPQRVAFVFTGQGAQWQGMGRELMEIYPSFRRVIKSLDYVLQKIPSGPTWSIEEILRDPSDTGTINEPEFSQTVCTALQIALVTLLSQWGVYPVAVVGHSSGEIGAAFASGRLSPAEAIMTAYYRGKVVGGKEKNGAMLAVGLDADDVEPFISEFGSKITIGCHNSPRSTTLSGERLSIEAVKDKLTKEKVFVRELRTGGRAYHSYLMKEYSTAYEKLLKKARKPELDLVGLPSPTPASPTQGDVSMFSSVTARKVEDSSPLTTEYWCQNLLRPVLFHPALRSLILADAKTHPQAELQLVEIGPHPALSGPIRDIKQDYKMNWVNYLPTLRRGENAARSLLSLAGSLYLSGCRIDIKAVNSVEKQLPDGSVKRLPGRFLLDLPRYQWNYDRTLWDESRASKELRNQRFPRHDILGRIVPGCTKYQPVWRNILRRQDISWLEQHKLGNNSILPAAAYWAMAIEAIRQHKVVHDSELASSYTLSDVHIKAALIIPDSDDGIEVFTALNGIDGGRFEFVITACKDRSWTTHCTGVIAINRKKEHTKPRSVRRFRERYTGKHWYGIFADVGFDYGTRFQGLKSVETNPEVFEARASIALVSQDTSTQGESDYAIHPTVSDSALQLVLVAIHAGKSTAFKSAFVPVHAREITVWEQDTSEMTETGHAVAWTDQRGERSVLTGAQIFSSRGHLLAHIDGLVCVAYEGAVPLQSQAGSSQFLELSWKPDVEHLSTRTAMGLFATMDPSSQLKYLCDILAHKQSSRSILQIEPDVTGLLNEARWHCKQYTIVSAESQWKETYSFPVKIVHPADIFDRSSNISFDLVISRAPTTIEREEALRSRVAVNGYLLLLDLDPAQARTFVPRGFTMRIRLSSAILASRVAEEDFNASQSRSVSEKSLTEKGHLILIYQETPPGLLSSFSDLAVKQGWTTEFLRLDGCMQRSLEGKHVVMFADLESPILYDMNQKQLEQVQRIIQYSETILWTTQGRIVSNASGRLDPRHAMAAGFLRSAMREHPTLNMRTVDIDFENANLEDSTIVLLELLEEQIQRAVGRRLENEVAIKDGIAHVSRIAAHRWANDAYAATLDERHTSIQKFTLGTRLVGRAQDSSLRENIWHCEEDACEKLEEGSEDLVIQVSECVLNDKSISVISGATREDRYPYELTGTVGEIGEKVDKFCVGDRVTAISYGRVGTHIRVPAAFCHKCSVGYENDIAELDMCLLPKMNAIYSLEELSRIEQGETLLIAMDTGLAGIFAALIGLAHGAEVFALYSSQAENEYLRAKIKIPERNLLSVLENECLAERLKARAPGGVDIALVTSASPITEIIGCLGPLGRVVNLIGSEPEQDQKHRSDIAAQASSYHYVDWSRILKYNPRLVSKLVLRAASLVTPHGLATYQSRIIFGVDEIDRALSTFRERSFSEDVVLSFRKTEGKHIKIRNSAKSSKFDPTSSYLLVGCLGGIGRTIVTWMVARGARNLCFLSRSGLDNSEASSLVAEVQQTGAHCTVVRGDVSKQEDVVRAVAQAEERAPIKGVINAAMVLKDWLFERMDVTMWHDAVRPKVQGSLNLHHALSASPLDFFVMTSSTSGILGGPGQSNYAAANNFLDYFAKHRRSLGLPATSLVLPMILGVGVVANNSELETSLLSQGLYGIEPEELLRALDLAVRDVCEGQLIVGLEASKLAKAWQRAPRAEKEWIQDARCQYLRTLIDRIDDSGSYGTSSTSETILEKLEFLPDPHQAVEFVLQKMKEKIGTLLLTPTENVQPDKAMNEYGLDSTLGTELRTWIFKEFVVEIPYFDLIETGSTLRTISGRVYKERGGKIKMRSG